jgi:L-rhamnose mutarotase
MQRYGMIIGLKPEKLEEYKRLHRAVWPGVLEKITECNIRNYSIFLRDNTLFAYFEYVGSDFTADMAKMAADPTTQQWWKETDPCQHPVASAKEGEWWANLDEVFHCD